MITDQRTALSVADPGIRLDEFPGVPSITAGSLAAVREQLDRRFFLGQRIRIMGGRCIGEVGTYQGVEPTPRGPQVLVEFLADAQAFVDPSQVAEALLG